MSLVVNTCNGFPSATRAIRYCAEPAAPVQVTLRFDPVSVTCTFEGSRGAIPNESDFEDPLFTAASGVAVAEYAKPGSRFETTTWPTPAATVNFFLVPSEAVISIIAVASIAFQVKVAAVPDNE